MRVLKTNSPVHRRSGAYGRVEVKKRIVSTNKKKKKMFARVYIYDL